MSTLKAWVNLGPGAKGLHVTGGKVIQVPNLNDRVIGQRSPDIEGEPDVYQIKAVVISAGIGLPAIGHKPMEDYTDEAYSGGYTDVKVTYPDKSTEEAVIETVH